MQTLLGPGPLMSPWPGLLDASGGLSVDAVVIMASLGLLALAGLLLLHWGEHPRHVPVAHPAGDAPLAVADASPTPSPAAKTPPGQRAA